MLKSSPPWQGCARQRVVAASSTGLTPQQRLNRFRLADTTPANKWRWFGFHATASQQSKPAEVVSLAASDLESGDFYTTLVNPKLHNGSRYRLTTQRLCGKGTLI